jgi:hypothetical protein
VLSFSGWTHVALAASETFEALVAGLQGAVWTLGAVPDVVRHDNVSAATHELKCSGGRQLTERFRGVLDHYGLGSSRIHRNETPFHLAVGAVVATARGKQEGCRPVDITCQACYSDRSAFSGSTVAARRAGT